MLKNAYLDAKIGFDPAENGPPKGCPLRPAPRQGQRHDVNALSKRVVVLASCAADALRAASDKPTPAQNI